MAIEEVEEEVEEAEEVEEVVIITNHLAEAEVITMNRQVEEEEEVITLNHQPEVAIIINLQVEEQGEDTLNPIHGAAMTCSNLNPQSQLIESLNKALIKIPMTYKTIINFQRLIKPDNRHKTPALRKDSKIKNSSSQCDSIEAVE